MEESFKIPSFQSGINEYLAEGLIKPYEAISANNCVIKDGSLKTFNAPDTKATFENETHSLLPYFFNASKSGILCGVGTELIDGYSTKIYDISGERLDSVNFQHENEKVLIATSKSDTPFVVMRGFHFLEDAQWSPPECRKLRNRRKKFDEEGKLVGYIDANGVEHATESTITTYAPKGSFIELHYDRLWIAGDVENEDRVYFSTANVNGADIEDFTVPLTEEDEINQHGGFLDVRSYDGGRIIGMKVVFNSIVIFKEKTAYKVYGNNPENYQLVELFSCRGAIADKSIAVGNNGAYFLNRDGIYFYDGTNTTLISQKIQRTINRMNRMSYDKSVATFYDNKYYLAIPVDNSNENNVLIEFDVISGAFMTYDIDNIIAMVDTDGWVHYSNGTEVKTLSDGTNPTPLIWLSPRIDFGKKNARKMSTYIYFRAKGEGSIKFTLISERKEKELVVELTSEEKLYRKKLKNKGRMFQLKIENVDNSSFELLAPQIVMEIDED